MVESDRESIDLDLSNYYGRVTAERNGDKYTMRLDDVGGFDEIDISKEFFDAIRKEFAGKTDGK